MIKRFLILASFLITVGVMGAQAQVKPYIAIINTGEHVFKGVLYHVTPDSVGVKKDQDVVFFKADQIKNIKVKEMKRGFRYKKYLTYDPNDEKTYEKVTHKMVPVRKWGEKDPTVEEELGCRIITSFYNTAINGVFASIGLMSGCLSSVNINYNVNIYKANVKALAFHSITYQNNPNDALELQTLQMASTHKGN
ncbi:hypothetical protein [Pedobacter sp.]|uniref:hypothetical protein n=1 Tax=Pedobacter sp. TaxID=1411316 RepID=UPI003D7F4125